ncbi:ATP-binding protein [Lentzea tibetensis]|uniref:ATP-binding protein n=1 Tax=Lentzea tibetensis TaxID=2591470 RepID=UPI001F35EF76|nr:LuxR C-terminal-related transcriptional regulator [Lentzea tibetensis]
MKRDLADFIGRAGELNEVRRLLRSRRLVTLVGPGGSGKTRLAEEVLKNDHQAVRVHLDVVSRPDSIWHAIASAVDVREQVHGSIIGAVVQQLASTQSVVLLDNCEHLVEACAQVVTQLLRACDRLRVLVTSRQPLDLDGEACVYIGPMDPADATALFLRRADAVQAHLVAGDRDHDLIGRLCDRVEHLPLPIELVARRLRTLSLAEIEQALEKSMRSTLVPGDQVDPASPPRHRTIDAVVAWSYERLSAGERDALNRLSILVGTFDLDLGVRVCGDSSTPRHAAIHVISSLCAKSMLVREEEKDQLLLFRLLEPVRQFAADRLKATNGTDQTYDRLVAALVDHARSGWELDEPRPNEDRILVLHAHLINAHDWCKRRNDPRHGYLAISILDAWTRHGHAKRVLHLAQQMLAEHGYSDYAAEVHYFAAWSHIRLEQGAEALRHANQLRNLWKSRSSAYQAVALNTVGFAAIQAGDDAQAIDVLRASVRQAVQSGDALRSALCMSNLVKALCQIGQKDEALAVARQSLLLLTDDAAGYRKCYVHTSAGFAMLDCDHLDEARTCFTEGVITGANTTYFLSFALHGLALVASRQGDASQTAVLLGAAAQALQRAGTEPWEYWKQRTRAAEQMAVAELGSGLYRKAHARGTRLTHTGLVDIVSRKSGTSTTLTRRQEDIARLILAGRTNAEIAEQLGIALGTVRTHVSQMLRRHGAGSRAELARLLAEFELD